MSRLVIALLVFAAAPAAASPPDLSGEWPSRWGREDARVQGVVREIADRAATLRLQRVVVPMPEEDDLADAAALADGRRADFAFEGEGSTLLFPIRQARRLAVGPTDAALVFRFISGAPAANGEVRLQRTTFAYYEPEGGAPRALLLLCPGLFGQPEPVIELLIRQRRAAGWGVLRMMAQPSRFTERRTVTIDAGLLDSAAASIAADLTDRAAECAYAVEAAIAHLLVRRPELEGKPIAAVGMSAGAMTMPTIIARDPARFKAAVLVAGGADFMSITLRSNFSAGVRALQLDWTAPARDEDKARLNELYRARAMLDPLNVSALVRSPVLMIHGEEDVGVPSDLGDLLWERLGRPERWTGPVGHEVLLLSLPARFEELEAWIDRSTFGLPEPGGGR